LLSHGSLPGGLESQRCWYFEACNLLNVQATAHTAGSAGKQIINFAVVGDSLFAGSMGGAPNDYRKALRNNVEKLLSLPADTLICPGHGPLTTVANEREHNPFFAP
jgi:glyoxylase-like metal-dependent hydrolase (beta-lactamase superfamily II)